MSGFITAFRTLTIFPIRGKDAEKFASSLYWFPLIGLMLGMVLYSIAVLIERYGSQPWPEGVALLLVVLAVIMTRGLHLDGLSDWADGFWGGCGDKDRTLAIMKDSQIGTFGGAALVIVLLAKFVCFSRLVDTSETHWILIAFVVSRSMQAVLAASHPYARSDGGTARSFVEDAGGSHRAVVLFASVVLIVLFGGVEIPPLAVFGGAWLITILFGKWATRKIGGVTGDIIGAGSEIIETLVLAAGAVLA